MPLFRCEECGCVENTATGFYWERDSKALWGKDCPQLGKKLCSEHGPKFFVDGQKKTDYGVWHGLFEKKSAEGYLVDKSGFLWSPSESLPGTIQIVGKISSNGEVIPL